MKRIDFQDEIRYRCLVTSMPIYSLGTKTSSMRMMPTPLPILLETTLFQLWKNHSQFIHFSHEPNVITCFPLKLKMKEHWIIWPRFIKSPTCGVSFRHLLKSSNDINNKATNKRPMPINETCRHINTPIIEYTLEKSQKTTNN